MDTLTPLLPYVLAAGLMLVVWLLFRRLETLLAAKKDVQTLLLIQQQIDQVRNQFSQALEGNTRLINQQLGQVLGHVSDRLKEHSEILQRTQQNLGERLDSAARVVGNVQKSLGGLEEANRKSMISAKTFHPCRRSCARPSCAAAWASSFSATC